MKKYIFPFFALLILTAFLHFSFKFINKPMIFEEKEAEEVVGPVLKMSPGSVGTRIGESFNVNLILDAKNFQATAVDLTVNYDPNILRVNSIISGSFLTTKLRNPTISNGKITLALGCAPKLPKTGEGILATINFTVLNYGNTTVNYSSLSQVSALGQSGNIIVSSYGTNIIIPTPTLVPTSIPLPTITLIPLITPTNTLIPAPSTRVFTPTPTIQPTAAVTVIKIFAAGRKGGKYYPNMSLLINGEEVAIFYGISGNPYTRYFKVYTYKSSTPVIANQVEVKFINDYYNPSTQEDRNLRVDKIKINGINYQSEEPTTYSTGTWSKATNCKEGYKRSEWLHCNGGFRY